MNFRLLLAGILLGFNGTSYAQTPVPPGLNPGDDYHLIFVTSSVFSVTSDTSIPPATGNRFGGLTAADWQVTNLASDAGMVPGWNGLDTPYTALLSTPSDEAIDRLGLAGPIYGMDGTLIATGEADFFDGTLASGIYLDEMLGDQSGERVWTATTSQGISENSHCLSWTNGGSSNFGVTAIANDTFSPFSSGGDYQCHQQARLFGVSPLLTVPVLTTKWIEANGGSFSDAAHWDNGVPGEFDIAEFSDIDPLAPVTFSANATVLELNIGTDSSTQFAGGSEVEFDLNGHTLTTSHLELGHLNYDSGDLTIVDGQLDVNGPILSYDTSKLVVKNGGVLNATTYFGNGNDLGLATTELLIDSGGTATFGTIDTTASGGSVIEVTGGGILNSGDASFLPGLPGFGTNEHSRIEINGSGSIWNSMGDINLQGDYIALGNFSTLLVDNGGSVVSTGELSTSELGRVAILDGSVTVGSLSLDPLDSAALFHSGGTLTIDGGTFNNGGGTLFATSTTGNPLVRFINGATATQNQFRIGYAAGEMGQIEISGTGTDVDVPEDVWIARFAGGEGSLTVTDNGRLDIVDDLLMGFDGGQATVNVSADGLITVGDQTFVGREPGSTSTLNLSSGGKLEGQGRLRIGDNGGSQGEVYLTDPNTEISIGVGGIWLGSGGTGILSVSNQAAVNVAEPIEIGRTAASTGSLLVSSAGTVTTSTSMFVGGNASATGGQGSLLVSGGNVTVGTELVIWDQGSVNLSGGKLTAGSIDNTSGGTFNFTGGELHVEVFYGPFTQQGGTLAPGNSIGDIEFFGNVDILDGSVEIEIGGTDQTEYDHILFWGPSTQLGGTLDIKLIDLGLGTFEPSLGDAFGIFGNLTEPIGTWFDTVNYPALPAGLAWEFDFQPISTILKVVPEPIPGDFDDDGDVDGDDLTDPVFGWEARFGSDLDGLDFLTWQRQFGIGVSPVVNASSAVAAPEPSSMILSCLAGLVMMRRRRSIARTSTVQPRLCRSRGQSF